MCLEVRMHRTLGRVIEMVSDGVVCYTELLSLPSPPLPSPPLPHILLQIARTLLLLLACSKLPPATRTSPYLLSCLKYQTLWLQTKTKARGGVLVGVGSQYE